MVIRCSLAQPRIPHVPQVSRRLNDRVHAELIYGTAGAAQYAADRILFQAKRGSTTSEWNVGGLVSALLLPSSIYVMIFTALTP